MPKIYFLLSFLSYSYCNLKIGRNTYIKRIRKGNIYINERKGEKKGYFGLEGKKKKRNCAEISKEIFSSKSIILIKIFCQLF